MFKILIAEHNPSDADFIENELNIAGFNYISKIVKTEIEYTEALSTFCPDVILSDFTFPSFDGLRAFDLRNKMTPDVSFIFVSGTIGEEKAVQLIRNGVTDYVLKDKLYTLPIKIERALKEASEKKEREIAENKLLKANNLYAFISQINQNIVRVKDEAILFRNACQIAVKFGKFKMAWIGLFDSEYKTISLAEQTGMAEQDTHLFVNAPCEKEGPQAEVIRTNSYYVCNDIQKELKLQNWRSFAVGRNLNSCIVLPIKRFEKIIGTLNLYSNEKSFADEEEIELLVEIASDISFALDLFERENIHKELEKEQAKSKLKTEEDESKYRSFFENSMDGILLTNPNGNIIAANPSACEILQRTEREICEEGREGIIDTKDPNLKRLLKIRENKGKAKGELIFIRKDGTEFLGELTSSIFTDGFGYERTSLIFRDISERRQNEITHLRNEAKLNEAQAIAHLGSWELNLETGDVLWSKESCRIFGLSTEDTNQSVESWLSFIHPGDLETVLKESTNARKTLTDYIMGYRILLRDGTIKYIYSKCKFEIDKNGVNTGIHGIMLDVTDIKLAEIEREKMIDNLVQHTKKLEQFTFIVSHNLRAPVAHILGLSQVLKSNISEADRVKSQDFLYQATERLDDTLKDLNKILELRSDVTKHMEPIFLNELVDTVESSIASLIKVESAQIITDFTAINKITSTRTYIHSIFYNLISNSLKYKQLDQVPIIKITTQTDGKKVTISFKDNGTGIDLIKHGDSVFGIYKRFNLGNDGKGLGLFMVKTQVGALGGNIRVESKVGEGTEFIIELPL